MSARRVTRRCRRPAASPRTAAGCADAAGPAAQDGFHAKARKNDAGTSPITKASGTKKIVLAPYARNRRLGDALQKWAFCSMRGSPGATAYYQ